MAERGRILKLLHRLGKLHTEQQKYDADGLSDEYEQRQSVLDWWNPDDAGADSDQDGLTNRDEAAWGTELTNPDSDGDGVLDGAEVAGGSSPNDPAGRPESPRLLVSSTELSFVAAADGPNPEPPVYC